MVLLMSTSSGHASNGHRHVVPSAVSLADVYSSSAKPVLERVAGCRLPRVGEAGFLPISAKLVIFLNSRGTRGWDRVRSLSGVHD